MAGEAALPTRVAPRAGRIAEEITVISIAGLERPLQLLLTTLQGLVNRRQPRLYYLSGPDHEDNPEYLWLRWMERKGHRLRWVDDWRKVFEECRAAARGAVVHDPGLDATAYAATTLAGLESLVAASPELAETLRLPIVRDLRGRWEYDFEVMEWALRELWPRCRHDIAFLCVHDPYNVRRGEHPHACEADYIVAHRLFALRARGSVHGKPPFARFDGRDAAVTEAMLRAMEPNRLILGHCAGCLGEHMSINVASRHAKFTTYAYNYNLSLHSAWRPAPRLKHKPIRFRPLERKVYLTFIYSDGDNLALLPATTRHWRDPARGRLPLGYNLAPSILDLAPSLAGYFADEIGESEYLVAACSGMGYTDPEYYGREVPRRDAVYREFLELTGRYMARLDMREIWPIKATRETNRRYARAIPGLNAIFSNFTPLPSYRGANYFEGDVAVFNALVGPWGEPEQEGQAGDERITQPGWIVRTIRRKTPKQRPAFMFAGTLCAPAGLLEVQRALGDEYVIVRPDEFVHLFRQASGR